MLKSRSTRKMPGALLVWLILAFALVAPSRADEEGFDEMRLAVQKALWRHQEARDVHFSSQGWYLAGIDSNHEFHIKPPIVRQVGRGASARTRISGQVSREKRARKDDQYYYTIEFDEKGSVLVFSERINDNARRTLIGRREHDEVSANVSFGMSHNYCREFIRKLNASPEPLKTYYGNYDWHSAWQSGARCIALTSASEAYSGRPGNRRDFRN